MSRFDYVICYENRSRIHTSRWRLDGISTRGDGNTARGWLWMSAALSGDTATIDLFSDPGCQAADKVAEGSADVWTLDAGAVKVSLSEANGSGLSGQLYIERFAADSAGVPVLGSLCVDEDLAEHYQRIDALPGGVYDADEGLARFCAAATRKTLLLVSQLYRQELGGYGGPEDRRLGPCAREVPDFRRIAAPDQLRETAVHWALALALGSCHDRAGETLYRELRDYHDRRREQVLAAWNLTLNLDPDADGQADAAASAVTIRPTRL